MTWDDLLRSLRQAGFETTEDDFMEDYGPIATDELEGLRGRRFRYTFGAASIGALQFQAYAFSSEAEAEDFREAVGAEGGWYRRRNMVFHTSPEEMHRLIEVLGSV